MEQGKGPRILVVEDDPTINQALADRLVAEGIRGHSRRRRAWRRRRV